MYNKFLKEKEINVKIGDTVAVQGNIGCVTDVYKGVDMTWDGVKYVSVAGTEYTNIRVHFIDDLAEWGQYQDGVYGGYEVIESK